MKEQYLNKIFKNNHKRNPKRQAEKQYQSFIFEQTYHYFDAEFLNLVEEVSASKRDSEPAKLAQQGVERGDPVETKTKSK